MKNNQNPVIFLSYSWANVVTADEIDNDFRSIGIQFRRDIRDAPYRSSIKEFMNSIGASDFVLMIISDEYLKSLNCMYEVTELLNSHQFEKRILPIVLENARHIFKPLNQECYYDFWLEEKKKAEKLKKKHANEVSIEYLKKCQSIQDNLPKFFQKVTDMNVSTFENLKRENYGALIKIVDFDNQRLLEEVIKISKISNNEDQELELELLLKENPNNFYALFQKACLAEDNSHYKRAKKYYEEIISSSPENSVVHYNLAILLQKRFDDFINARLHYEQSIRINQYNTQAHYNLALLLSEKLGDYSNAKYHYEQAIKHSPQKENAYFNLAVLLREHFEDLNGAKDNYEKALQIDPEKDDTHENLAEILVLQSDYESAKSHYEEALRINPDNKSANHALALLLEHAFRDYTGAMFHFRKALEIDSDFEVSKNSLDLLIAKHFNK